MAAAEPKTEKQAAGDIDASNVKELLFNFAWWMKKQGYAESTILSRTRIMKNLSRRIDIFDPESVKELIAKQKWTARRKQTVAEAYSCFLRMHELTWNPPKYRAPRTHPFIPHPTEVEQLIAGCSKSMATLLQFLKETGARIGEAQNLNWTDIDFQNQTVTITPEKGSDARVIRISSKLASMLSERMARSAGDRVFHQNANSLRSTLIRQRKRVASKLKNPRINRITFHTLRHFKATMEYQRTKDILHVKRLLGHRNINNTLIYTHLVDFEALEYVSKVATSIEEACKLVDAGFEYVCDVDGAKIFRKPKWSIGC